MGLRQGSPLACSINMRGRARGRLTPYTPPRETLAATSSQLNFEALTACVVLAHPRVTFHPCTCGFHRDVDMVATALIDYDHVKVTVETTTRKGDRSTNSSKMTCDYVELML
jgi:hypothetical protein